MISTCICDTVIDLHPTSDQVEFAKEYLAEAGLNSGFVAVDSSGGAVMDGVFSAIWVDKDSALAAFSTRVYGTVMFRIYVDGHFHVIDELE